MNIEKFHELYWTGKTKSLRDHVHYSKKKSEKKRHHNDEEDGIFDPTTA